MILALVTIWVLWVTYKVVTNSRRALVLEALVNNLYDDRVEVARIKEDAERDKAFDNWRSHED